MANDEQELGWSAELVRRVGAAVKDKRGGRSAKWLSERTAELGYRVSPTVIAKLDSGHRGEVLSVAEWLILAAALDISPIQLLYPKIPDGPVEMLPGHLTASISAALWVSGQLTEWLSWVTLPKGMVLDHKAQQVMDWARERVNLESRVRHLTNLRDETDEPETVETMNREIAKTEGRIRVLNDWLRGRGALVDDPRFADNA